MSEYNIKRETLRKWLSVLYEISGSTSLDNAISIAKMSANNEEEAEISSAIAVLFRAECSGEINPPIAMREFYAELVAEKQKRSRETAS